MHASMWLLSMQTGPFILRIRKLLEFPNAPETMNKTAETVSFLQEASYMLGPGAAMVNELLLITLQMSRTSER